MAASLPDDFKLFFNKANVLNRLILINVLVFFILKLLSVIFFLFRVPNDLLHEIVNVLAVPADFQKLLHRPWTIFTYMFLHEGFMHILFNMLMLFWMGKIFMEYLDGKKLLSTYILGGIAGAALYILTFNLFPAFNNVRTISYALGASAGILAIVIATATLLPNYKVQLIFIGPVSLKYIAWILVILDVLNINESNPGGHIAHLGGAIFGFVYIKRYQKGQDIAAWFHFLADKVSSVFRKRSKLKVSYKRSYTDEDYLQEKKNKQEIVDAILDKIAQSGYESLTKKEKEILFKASKEG